MIKLDFSIVINASSDKIWHTMLDENSYRAWTDVFSPGSHYIGDWNEGSKILFLAPEETGRMSGMVRWILAMNTKKCLKKYGPEHLKNSKCWRKRKINGLRTKPK